MPQFTTKTPLQRNYLILGVLSMAWLFYALDGAVISVLITNQSFNKTFDIDPNRLGLFSLFPSIGALFGVVGFAGYVNRVFGRIRAFQISTSLVIIGVIFQTFPDNYGLLLFGRFVMGVGGDTNGQTLGYYVAEVSQKQFFGIAGTWIAYGIAYLPQDKSYSWKVANSLQFAPGVVFFFLCFWLPESPRWLARKYDLDDSPMVAALTVLRGRPASHPEVQEEAREIRAYNTWALQNESSSIFNILTEPRLRRRFFYVMVPWLAQIFCGVQLLTIYAVIIYQSLGLTSQKSALLLNSCLSVLYAAAALGSSWVVEKFGRRPCIVYGSSLMTLCLAFITGIAIGTESNPTRVANGFVVAFIVLATTIYWFLYTGPTTIYCQEIMPNHAREMGVPWANVIPVALNIVLGQQWPNATASLGPRSYAILLATSSFASVLCYLFVKEPKGLSVERIDALFGERDHVDEIEAEEAGKHEIVHLEEMRKPSENDTSSGGKGTQSAQLV